MTAQSEISIQALFRSRCKILCPAVSVIAIPNAAKRSQWAAAQVKREGLVKGAPDVVCIWPNSGIAWIEFKAAKGKVSESQVEFHELLQRYGHRITVARSPDEALDFLRSCGAPFIGRISA